MSYEEQEKQYDQELRDLGLSEEQIADAAARRNVKNRPQKKKQCEDDGGCSGCVL